MSIQATGPGTKSLAEVGARARALRRPAESAARVASPVVGVALAALILAGCQQSKPEAVDSGEYRFLASSSGSDLPNSVLAVAESSVTLTQGTEVTRAAMGQPGESYIVCPPSLEAAPIPLMGSLTVGDMQLASPALFGDCGDVRPVRVTLIDLDSYDEGAGGLPFTRWAEFCGITDPDC